MQGASIFFAGTRSHFLTTNPPFFQGYGFVDFVEKESGDKALNMVDGMTIEGRELAVKISEDKYASSDTRGGRGGRGGGRGGGDFRGRGRGGGGPPANVRSSLRRLNMSLQPVLRLSPLKSVLCLARKVATSADVSFFPCVRAAAIRRASSPWSRKPRLLCREYERGPCGSVRNSAATLGSFLNVYEIDGSLSKRWGKTRERPRGEGSVMGICVRGRGLQRRCLCIWQSR